MSDLGYVENLCIKTICPCGIETFGSEDYSHTCPQSYESIFCQYYPTHDVDLSFNSNFCPCGGFAFCDTRDTHFRPSFIKESDCVLLTCRRSQYCSCGYYYLGPLPANFICLDPIPVANTCPHSS